MGDMDINIKAVKFINTVISKKSLLTAPKIEVFAVRKIHAVVSWMTVCGYQRFGRSILLLCSG
jgi:hypothetical protein